MMERPVIGILGNLFRQPQSAFAAQMTYVNSAYCNAVRDNGGIPFLIPVMGGGEDLRTLLNLCDGLLFPGGDDGDPFFYGEDPSAYLGNINRNMDRFWILAEQTAEEMQMPVLGICRGMQMVNVARGGSLYQDISLMEGEHQLHAQKQNRDYPMHRVKIQENTALSDILGVKEIYTNTLHHQCVKQPGRDLFETAWAGDGVAEAMESRDRRILLVQWHPEELTETVPEMKGIFRDFSRRCLEYKNRRQKGGAEREV